MKMSFQSHVDKTYFDMKSFARSLALKKRHKTIRKWPNLWERYRNFNIIKYETVLTDLVGGNIPVSLLLIR